MIKHRSNNMNKKLATVTVDLSERSIFDEKNSQHNALLLDIYGK